MNNSIDELSNLTTTILYVDDEEMARKYFARVVGTHYKILTAAGADEAIAMLQDQSLRIGVLVTDYRMPGRDGGSLLRQIEDEHPHIVRILMTAYADKDLLLDTVNSGDIFRILEKPMDLAEVRKTLLQATERSRERIARQQRLMAIDETLAFLAHELNTPLATIVNFARGVGSRLGDKGVSPLQQAEIGNAASAISANAQYCFSVLSKFIEAVRNAGHGPLSQNESSASQLISSLLDTYPLTHEQRNMIHFGVSQDFRIGTLPNCISLVVSSILNNALRALSNHPSPLVRIAVVVEDCPKIRISDNGPGISPEILGRLLVDPITTHSESGGTGWGIVFCKRIMQSFGGGIVIQSVQNERTTVTLNFPTLTPTY